MAEILSINNTSTASVVASTFLNQAATAGQNQLVVQNAGDVPDQTFAVVGTLGAESTELVPIATQANDTITLLAELTRSHGRLTDVSVIQADIYRVYRAPNIDGTAPLDTSFEVLTDIGIRVDSPQTTFVDETGGAAWWYKVTQFNSLTDQETALADAQASRGGSVGEYATLEEIRSDAGLEAARNIPDAVVSMYRRRAQTEIDSKLAMIFKVPFVPVPDVITQITCLIAAGWLLVKEYGELDEMSKKSGYAKMKEGRDWLKSLVDGSASIPGVDGIPQDRNDDVIGGFPDDTSAPMFDIAEKF